ncbi:sugar phosphate isomerase/epimerase [Pelagicoccus sp. SDUM812002]|uniref:sugar phosphate isomerase/epimerase family protein n=1 Tax=Pelagicoccus sp. SDUM812002 TaxID=3041266 RepID=UPI00280F9352|nr:sugar phosphate isomerase/epimerase [Pelagicoccus sp. SDUM812002]MDQ8188387.1 sugar phosphate isomerase/epimerase [Pelagicoccus sp. SDUM812002]
MSLPKIGLIGIVKEDLEADLWRTLERVSKLGYEGIELDAREFERQGMKPSELSNRLSEIGIELVTAHCTKYSYLEHGDALIQQAAEMGSQHLCIAWGPTESADQLSSDAELYNEMGARCRELGMALTYHNHDHEFARMPDSRKRYLDALMQLTDPDLVRLHLDIAWATFGGVDALAYAELYADRIAVLHMKDLQGLEVGCETAGGSREKARFLEVGDGIVPCAEMAEFAVRVGINWLVVEQDRPAVLSPWESVGRSLGNLQLMLRPAVGNRVER